MVGDRGKSCLESALPSGMIDGGTNGARQGKYDNFAEDGPTGVSA